MKNCWSRVLKLAEEENGPGLVLPQIIIEGHDPTFPYILSHLQYIIGELLRNSVQALLDISAQGPPPPIQVLICETPKHVIIRISDQGKGIPPEVIPVLWSFSKQGRRQRYLENLARAPMIAATMQELKPTGSALQDERSTNRVTAASLSRLSARPSELRLVSPIRAQHFIEILTLTKVPQGMGLPMSRIYAEYGLQRRYT